MKTLMQMFAAEDKGVIFFETVLSLKHQKHTFIECVPVPWEQFDDLPGYFKVRLTFFFFQKTGRLTLHYSRNLSSNRNSNGHNIKSSSTLPHALADSVAQWFRTCRTSWFSSIIGARKVMDMSSRVSARQTGRQRETISTRARKEVVFSRGMICSIVPRKLPC